MEDDDYIEKMVLDREKSLIDLVCGFYETKFKR